MGHVDSATKPRIKYKHVSCFYFDRTMSGYGCAVLRDTPPPLQGQTTPTRMIPAADTAPSFFSRGLHHARFTVFFKPGAVALICWLRSVVLCPHRPLQHPPVKAIVIDNRAMANLWRSFLFYLVFLFRPSACCCSWKYPSDYAIKYHTRISTRCSNFLLCSSLLAPCCATESTLSSCPL